MTQQPADSTPTFCPRCKSLFEQFPGDIGATSRMDLQRDVRICGPCGEDEAVRGVMGKSPVPYGEWPVRERFTWDDAPKFKI